MSTTVQTPPNPAPGGAPPSAFSDRMVDMPAGTRERASAADEMIRKAAADRAAAEARASGQPSGQPPSEPATPPSAPPPPAPPLPAATPQNPPPAPLPAVPAVPGGEGDAALRAQLAALENEARTWRGRAEANQRQLVDQQRAVAELRASVDALRAAPPAPPAPPFVPLAPLSDKEREDYGPDLMDATARHAATALAPMISAAVAAELARIRPELDSLKNQSGFAAQTAEQLTKQNFYAGLDAAVPGWRESCDNNPVFWDWVQQHDDMYGRSRKESLDEALGSWDTKRVAAFFRAFLNQQAPAASRPGASAPALPSAAPPAGAPPAEPPPSLADFAAPGAARSAATPPTQGANGRVWTMSEVRAHYAAVGRGAFKGREAESLRIDREIAAANAEGRIDGSR